MERALLFSAVQVCAIIGAGVEGSFVLEVRLMPVWAVLAVGAILIWFSTTYPHTPIGSRSSAAVLWIGLLTIVGFLADLILAFRRQSRDK